MNIIKAKQFYLPSQILQNQSILKISKCAIKLLLARQKQKRIGSLSLCIYLVKEGGKLSRSKIELEGCWMQKVRPTSQHIQCFISTLFSFQTANYWKVPTLKAGWERKVGVLSFSFFWGEGGGNPMFWRMISEDAAQQ